MPELQWNDVVGSVGVLLILGSYLLFQLGRLDSTGLLYSLMNAIGAAMVALSLFIDFNLYALVIEVAWFLISAIGIVRWSRERTQRPDEEKSDS